MAPFKEHEQNLNRLKNQGHSLDPQMAQLYEKLMKTEEDALRTQQGITEMKKLIHDATKGLKP